MARGVNKVILIGNLGADPETRSLPNGNAVTNLNVATSKSWKDRESGQQQERTEWHRVVTFNRLAEIASQYLHKGSKVYLEGELRTRMWEKDGQKHYTTEIVANEMQMLDGRGDNAGGGGGFGGGGGGNSGGGNSGGNSGGASNNSSGGTSNNSGGGSFDAPPAEDFDDDIPF